MLTVQLPIPFLKNLADNPGYTDVWIRWITTYGEKIKDPFFMDWLIKTEKPVPDQLEALRQAYAWGQPYLQGFSFIKLKKTSKKAKLVTKTILENAERVLVYLNLRTQVEYGKIKKEPALKPIIEILNEGYSIWDCKKVIDNKYADWHKTEWEKFLRPSTLFNTKKFDEYLNQPIKYAGQRRESAGGNFESIHDAVREADEINKKMGQNQPGNSNSESD